MLIMSRSWALGRLFRYFIPVSLLASSSTMRNINHLLVREEASHGPWAAVIHHPFHCWATLSYVADSQQCDDHDGKRPIYRR